MVMTPRGDIRHIFNVSETHYCGIVTTPESFYRYNFHVILPLQTHLHIHRETQGSD